MKFSVMGSAELENKALTLEEANKRALANLSPLPIANVGLCVVEELLRCIRTLNANGAAEA